MVKEYQLSRERATEIIKGHIITQDSSYVLSDAVYSCPHL